MFSIYHLLCSLGLSVDPSPFDVLSLQPKKIPLTFLTGLLATNSLRFHLCENASILPFSFLFENGFVGYRFGVAVVLIWFDLIYLLF